MIESLVSIVIPVYNSEKYLRKCVESCIHQTYQNIEVILVNDGSTDNSANICNSLSAQYKQVVVHHRKNGGVSCARNDGLAMAKGEYIAFVDSDDFVSPVYIEKLLKVMNLKNVDLAICGYTSEEKDMEKISVEIKHIKTLDADHIYNHMLNHEGYDGYLWNKLFLKEIIVRNNLSFLEKLSIWEDMYFVLCYLKNIKQVASIENKLYFYRVEGQGVTSKNSLKCKESLVTACKLFVELEKSSETLYFVAAHKLLIRQLYQYLKEVLLEKIVITSSLLEESELLRDSLKMYKVSCKEYILSILVIIGVRLRYIKTNLLKK